MTETRRVLLLGGTREARDLATLLSVEPTLDVVSSLAGRTRDPILPVGDVREGGFGGVEGLRRYVLDNRIDHVVDATHPFAELISRHAHEACALSSVPLIALVRAPWTPSGGDKWIDAPSVQSAADILAEQFPSSTVLLTIGRNKVGHFAHLAQQFVVRSIDPPSGDMPARRTTILDRGPFSVHSERQLMAAHAIDVVVTKNSGGPLTQAKLTAAREMGIPVVMIARPPRIAGRVVVNTPDAVAALLVTT